MSAPGAKASLRRAALQRRDSLAGRAKASVAIGTHLAALPAFQAARTIHCYLPIRSEVDTHPLLAHALARGIRVCVPLVQHGTHELAHSWLTTHDAATLVRGPFGTVQPRQVVAAPAGVWDLVLVPLVAFDRRGYRLGYGKGFYDRLLAAHPCPTVGLAFAAQEVEAVPHENHDMPLDWIVTEQGLNSAAAKIKREAARWVAE